MIAKGRENVAPHNNGSAGHLGELNVIFAICFDLYKEKQKFLETEGCAIVIISHTFNILNVQWPLPILFYAQ